MNEIDLIVIGAGPAGIRAAVVAAGQGLSVTILDEQQSPGGQIYRGVSTVSAQHGELLGRDYMCGRRLTDMMRDADLEYVFNATVWDVTADCCVTYSLNGTARKISGKRLVIATGALERPVTIPGWTSPGVLTAGAGQILLKQSGVLAERAVIAGSGPLIYLLAQQMSRAGTPPLALVETQSQLDMLKSLKHILGAVRGWRYLSKGLKMIREINRAGVIRYTSTSRLGIENNGQNRKLIFTHRNRTKTIECDTVFLHQGVVPNTQMTRCLGLSHSWDDEQSCFRPVLNEWYQTENSDIYVAGDNGGIIGATAAENSGALAALHILAELGKITPIERDRSAAPLQKQLKQETAIRPFLDAAYRPSEFIQHPDDDTIICRCEEITAGDIRHYVKLGCSGPNQTKAYGRCGMGPCQGRYCGLSVTNLLAKAHSTSANDIGYYRIRPPLKPITLGELASLDSVAGDH